MKSTAISIVIAGAFIGGAILYTGVSSTGAAGDTPADNVTIVDEKQIIEISARGGYRPQKSAAKAGVPTIVRFVTNGTYDCSGAVRIPSIGFSTFLPASGKTDANLGVPQAGTVRGMCAMGMYTFEIEFKG